MKLAVTTCGRGLGRLRSLLLAFFILALAGSCSHAPVKPPPADYYVTPGIAYLRDGPQGNILGQLYRGDRVVYLAKGGANWWRVLSQRTGLAGWIEQESLTPEPVAVTYYYMARDAVSLRECPRENCAALQQLRRGDAAQKVEAGEHGWWRILLAKSGRLGWVPGDVLANHPEPVRVKKSPPPPPPANFYVNASNLRLRVEPSLTAETLKMLPLNEPVQKLAQNPDGWVKVRQLNSNAAGWVLGSFLADHPQETPAAPVSNRYVAVKSLIVRLQPSLEAEVVQVLRFNEAVRQLEANPEGWVKVGLPGSDTEGWVLGRYLRNTRAASPRRPAPASRQAGKTAPHPQPAAPPKAAPGEPDVM